MMNIGDASKIAGLPVKTVRYYTDIGLIVAQRSENGYRSYGDQEISKLCFVQRTRSLGFSIDQCRTLLSLYEDKGRASAEVKVIAENHLEEIETKIVELKNLHEILAHLIHQCAGDDRPDCPIIEGLSDATSIKEYGAAKFL